MCGKANNATVIPCGNMESLVLAGVFSRVQVVHAVSGKFIKQGYVYRDHPQNKAVEVKACPFNGVKI